MKLVVDTHTHTIASGHAYSTLIENCKAASENGIELLGMTDHGPTMPGGAHSFYFGNIHIVPNFIHGVEVLKGCEVNILDFEGGLDLPSERLEILDLVIASLHDVCMKPGNKDENTRALINVMKNKYVDIIAHPGNPAFEIDVDEVLKAALHYNVLIEINNSSLGISSRPGSLKNCIVIAERAYNYGNKIAVGSDSHIAYTIGKFDKAMEIIKSAGIKEENIINTEADKLKNYLKEKGKLKLR